METRAGRFERRSHLGRNTLIDFWAKTTQEHKPGVSVYDHMVDVGCVARCICELSPGLLERFHLQSSVVGALAALHDLGKISPGFQRKCEVWIEESGLSKIARNSCWDTAMEADHGKVSHSAIQAFLVQNGNDRRTAKYVSAALGAHHGRLNPPNDRGYRPQKLISDAASGIDWDGTRMANAELVWRHFSEGEPLPELSETSPELWWLAGLTSVADWIGSDERFFPSEKRESPFDSVAAAFQALDSIGFRRTDLVQHLSFHDLFYEEERPDIPWIANDIQNKAWATITGPGVYVIEGPMGIGKTEAALWSAYQLLASGKARGIYFALPTQATSNRMHLRISEFVQRIAPTSNASRLIHGNSWLVAQTVGLSPVSTCRDSAIDDARRGRDWFASAKRALIAPFGVGTVDQALLGVVAAKHFFVRHFALAGKVIILDEVHSYDLYTGTLIDRLITTLEGLGCTVIVLSATLTGKRRGQIVTVPDNASNSVKLSYPLITGRKEGKTFDPVEATPPKPHNVKVNFISAADATDEAISLARNGGAVLWICNTVSAAQEQYRRLMEFAGGQFPIGLLHSRFPFHRREHLEDTWMKRFGKDGSSRRPSVLVSTQVVEQSVDLDADLLITELAPTDMLLQRLGRLWRHDREQRPIDSPCFCIIKEQKSLQEFKDMGGKAIVDALGGKAHVYDPFVLLRTLQLWENYQDVDIPTQIRELIEATYCDRDDDPEAWRKLYDERFVRDSNERFKATMNSTYWQPQLPDEEGVQTRLNDLPTVSVVLCRKISTEKAVFVDGTSEDLDGDEFMLRTAQAIHKNLVRVPEYCFDNIELHPAFDDYLHGKQCLGIVTTDGTVQVSGLSDGTRLLYSDELGLVIEKAHSDVEGT